MKATKNIAQNTLFRYTHIEIISKRFLLLHKMIEF